MRTPSIRKMIQEIRTVCWQLENDYNNPILENIKSHFQWYSYRNQQKDTWSEKEINEAKKNRIPVAIDFYERFCSQMESMMLLPGKNAISFAGP